MARNISVTLRLDNISIEEFKGLDFDVLKSDIGFLAKQPHLEIYDLYDIKDIDYEKGCRIISVRTEPGRPLRFSYTVIDSAGR